MVLDQSSEQLMVSVFEGTAVCFRKVFSLQPTNTTVCLTLLEESLTASEANRSAVIGACALHTSWQAYHS